MEVHPVLTRLLEEIGSTEPVEPNQKVGPDEKLIGDTLTGLSPFLRKTWTLLTVVQREHMHAHVDERFDPSEANRQRSKILCYKYDTLKELFWYLALSEVGNWPGEGSLSVRAGWVLVAVPEKPNPLKQLLEHLGGE